MASPLARRGHNATNVLHSLVYFAPEHDQRLTAAGLRPGRMSYLAGRAAPMGAVGPGVVTATFYNFSPALVARSIPAAWDLARPEAAVAARLAAAGAALTRLLGPEVIASPDIVTLGGLLRDAAAACGAEARPLYAGHADLDWPTAPHLVLWHAATLLREHRGDGHSAALADAGLTGLESLITHTATGKGFTPEFARSSRGWTDDEWDAAARGLAERGLLDAAGGLTPAGDALRAEVEDRTDRLAAAPWQRLGEERGETAVAIGRTLTRTALTAGAFPAHGVFPGR